MDVNAINNPNSELLTRGARNLNTTQKSTEPEPGEHYALTALAAYCTRVATVSEDVHVAARRTLLDTLGVAAAGSSTAGGKASLAAAHEIWGQGCSSAWFTNTALKPAGAAFVNATYAAALDLDDGHRQASGHPAAAIVPAVLAVGEKIDASPRRLLTAIALGYEISVRVSAARDIQTIRTTDSGLWCGLGVAAAAGWLGGLSAPFIAHAMAIAGQTSTSQAATGWTRLGHTVKEGIPWATANGLKAVALATAGHRGPLDMLDDPNAYNRQRLLDGWGRNWAIDQAYFKIYSCCRWAHAAIDGALMLAARMNILFNEIDDLVVETFDRALTLPNQNEPQSSEAAQYSIPFCIALGLVHGEKALLPLKDRYLHDPTVTALARRIYLSSPSDYVDAFPSTTPARVTIRAKGQKETIEVRFPRGDPQNPLTDNDLQAKFVTLAALRPFAETTARRILEAASCLGINQPSTALFAALRSSVD